MKVLFVLSCLVAFSQAGFLCDVCKEAVGVIISTAGGDIDKAKAIVASECKAHAPGFLDTLCVDGLDALLDEIMKYVNNGNSATEVCTLVHACSASAPETADYNQLCDKCDAIVGEVIHYIENGNLPNELDQLCQKIGIPNCAYFVNLLKKAIAQLGNDPAAICNAIPFCKTSIVKPKEMVAVKAGSLCQYCEDGVGVIENLLKNEESTITNDVKALCAKLPASEAGICSNLVDQYLPMIINKLLALLNPDTVCKGIHLCSSSTGSISLADLAQVGVDWNPVECDFCKMAFGFIQTSLMSPDFEQALLMDLAKGCQAIDDQKMQQECMDILGSYGEMILNYIKSLIAPDHICPLIKMCKAA